MHWGEAISRAFRAVVSAIAIFVWASIVTAVGVSIIIVMAPANPIITQAWWGPANTVLDSLFLSTVIATLFRLASESVGFTWAQRVVGVVGLLVCLYGILLLLLNPMMVFIKTITDAVVNTITTSTTRSRVTWRKSIRRAIGMVMEMLAIYALLAVALIIMGFAAIFTGEEPLILLGALLIIAGLILAIVGVFAVIIKSITDSVADHMPESDAISRISRREALRRAVVLCLSLIVVVICGGMCIAIGGGIIVGGSIAAAFQDSPIMAFLGIVVGVPLLILGILMLVAGPLAQVIWQISSSIADHMTGDVRISFRIKIHDRTSSGGLKWIIGLFFQIVAVYILAGTSAVLYIGGIVGIVSVPDIRIVAWIFGIVTLLFPIAVMWVGSWAIIIHGVSNAVRSIVSAHD